MKPKRGEGTKKERAKLEKEMARVMPRLAELAGDTLDAVRALAAVGVAVDPDEDFPTLVRRADDHSPAAPTVALVRKVFGLRESERHQHDSRRKTASRNASRSRSNKATPADARKFVADYAAKHGTKRGAITKGALEFGIHHRTFSKLLCTLD